MSNMQFPRIKFNGMQDLAITQISQQRTLEEVTFQATRIVPLILPVIISYMHIIKFDEDPLFHTRLQI